jgi:hypothetical protein
MSVATNQQQRGTAIYVPEQHLLVLLLTKSSYDKYKDFIDLDNLRSTYRELSYIYQTLVSLHDTYNQDLTIGELQAAFFVKYPDSDRVVYDNLFNQLSSIHISEDVGQGILADVRRRKGALKLSESAFKLAQGLIEPSALQETYEECFGGTDDHQPEDTLTMVSDNLEELIEQNYSEQGLRWRLDCLNKSLGSLRVGDFGFIFARPETGKTTFLASECTSFLSHCSRPLVWFNNEEQGHKVMLRIYQAYFGVTTDQLLANPAKYRTAFIEQTQGRFKLFDSATISRRDVETIVQKYQPELVIYDQIDKIKGFTSDRDDLRLGAIYQWARELAKGNHAAIGVCQADGHGEGVRYLTMEHVANAKTSKQAEADFIVGIGRSHKEEDQEIRYLNISKNKLLGDKDSLPELRHGHFEVLIEAHLARYKDIINYA